MGVLISILEGEETGRQTYNRAVINRIRTGTNRSGATRIAAAGVKSKNAVVPLLHGHAVMEVQSLQFLSLVSFSPSCSFYFPCLDFLPARLLKDVESDDVWHKPTIYRIPERGAELRERESKQGSVGRV